MTVLTILKAPDPRLKIKAKPIEKVDAEIVQLMEDMLDTMYTNDGCGLAATQVGIDKRVIVFDVGDVIDSLPNPYKMANPEIIWLSEEMQETNEGCLSVPDYFAKVKRPLKATVKYLNEHNETCHLEAEGFLADCIQHEIDHLNGVLFIDHLSALRRNMVLRKLMKESRRGS